jgi:protein FAM50
VDEQLKKSTIGLVTLEDFRKTRNEIEEAQRREAAQKQDEEATKSALKKKKKKEKKERPALSFNIDEEEEDEDAGSSSRKRSNGDSEGETIVIDIILDVLTETSLLVLLEAPLKKAKLSKNPTIDTSFLPDRDREARERLEREQLRREWLDKQEKLKNEAIEITYSYWDGTGHRKTVDVSRLSSHTLERPR